MAYATRTDLTQLAIPASAIANVPTAAQDNALEAASDLADSYLKSQYTLPIVAWESDLTRAVCNIAAYDIMSMRGYGPTAGGDENLRQRYEDAIRWLERIAKGEVSPKVTDSSAAVGSGTTTSGGVFVTTGSQRGWTGNPGHEGYSFWRPGDFDD